MRTPTGNGRACASSLQSDGRRRCRSSCSRPTSTRFSTRCRRPAGRARSSPARCCPGPYTLILPNPARRFRWLTGTRPETVGVRVPNLPRRPSTSCGGSARRSDEREPPRGAGSRRASRTCAPRSSDSCGAVVDGGELAGTPSTVVDLTGPEPTVLREGIVPAEEALAEVLRVLPESPRADEIAPPQPRRVSWRGERAALGHLVSSDGGAARDTAECARHRRRRVHRLASHRGASRRRVGGLRARRPLHRLARERLPPPRASGVPPRRRLGAFAGRRERARLQVRRGLPPRGRGRRAPHRRAAGAHAPHERAGHGRRPRALPTDSPSVSCSPRRSEVYGDHRVRSSRSRRTRAASTDRRPPAAGPTPTRRRWTSSSPSATTRSAASTA